jgi:hypothetical protein
MAEQREKTAADTYGPFDPAGLYHTCQRNGWQDQRDYVLAAIRRIVEQSMEMSRFVVGTTEVDGGVSEFTQAELLDCADRIEAFLQDVRAPLEHHEQFSRAYQAGSLLPIPDDMLADTEEDT